MFLATIVFLAKVFDAGSAVGIDVTPSRFVDGKIRDALDNVVTDIQGLYMTGQDTLLCGVTLAQVPYSAVSYVSSSV